jgi:hypothetical protein
MNKKLSQTFDSIQNSTCLKKCNVNIYNDMGHLMFNVVPTDPVMHDRLLHSDLYNYINTDVESYIETKKIGNKQVNGQFYRLREKKIKNPTYTIKSKNSADIIVNLNYTL